MNQWLSDANKAIFGLFATAIVALSSFVFDANTRIAVLESQAQTQMAVANENKENFRRLNEGIARLNIVLTVLSDRLGRDEKFPDPRGIVNE